MIQKLNICFNTKIAEVAGINGAVILNNLYFWITNNEGKKKNYYDGYYWTYNSVKTLKELFPCFTQKQVRTALKKLKEEGLIITGNYNKTKYDRTLWYAITYKGKCILQNCEVKDLSLESPVECICPCGQMEMTSVSNGFDQEGKPIPNNKQIENKNNYEERKKEEQKETNKKQNENNEIEVEYSVVDDLSYLDTNKEEVNRHLMAEKKEAENLPLTKINLYDNYHIGEEEKSQEEVKENQKENENSLMEDLSIVDILHSDTNEEEYDVFEESGKSPQTENSFTVKTEQINTKEISIYYEERKKEERGKNKSSYQPQAKNYKTYNEIIEEYTNSEELRNELKESLRVRKMKRVPLTNRALEINLEKLDKFSCNEKEKIEIVRESIANGWTTFYPLRKIYSNMQHNDVTGSKSSAYNIEEYDLLSAFD